MAAETMAPESSVIEPLHSWCCDSFAVASDHGRFVKIDNKAAVYRILHAPSGRFYVGSTVNARNRLKRHFYDLQSGAHHSPFLQRSWTKHGLSEFFFEIIEYIADRAWIIFHEQSYIDAFKGIDILFNTCTTAGNCEGVKHSAEAKEKRRISMTGRTVSEATKQAISAAKKGRCHESTRAAILASSAIRKIGLSEDQISKIKLLRESGTRWERIADELGMCLKPLRREVRVALGSDYLKQHTLVSRRKTIYERIQRSGAS